MNTRRASPTRPWRGLLAVCLISLATISQAAVVELKLPSGLVANAEYRQATGAKPAVLVLHGFLQTRNFPLIYSLTDGLAGEGYTVLAPNLALGVTNRYRSQPCEAVHTNTLADDVDELSRWVAWLAARGHKRIFIVGHSFGGVQALLYAADRPIPALKGVVALSLSSVDQKFWEPGKVNAEPAKAMLKRKSTRLGAFELGFCRAYRATPAVYLSFLEWPQERLIEKMRQVKAPFAIFVGDKDTIINHHWVGQIERAGMDITHIKGANHFFDDSAAEFEALSNVDAKLKTLNP